MSRAPPPPPFYTLQPQARTTGRFVLGKQPLTIDERRARAFIRLWYRMVKIVVFGNHNEVIVALCLPLCLL